MISLIVGHLRLKYSSLPSGRCLGLGSYSRLPSCCPAALPSSAALVYLLMVVPTIPSVLSSTICPAPLDHRACCPLRVYRHHRVATAVIHHVHRCGQRDGQGAALSRPGSCSASRGATLCSAAAPLSSAGSAAWLRRGKRTIPCGRSTNARPRGRGGGGSADRLTGGRPARLLDLGLRVLDRLLQAAGHLSAGSKATSPRRTPPPPPTGYPRAPRRTDCVRTDCTDGRTGSAPAAAAPPCAAPPRAPPSPPSAPPPCGGAAASVRTDGGGAGRGSMGGSVGGPRGSAAGGPPHRLRRRLALRHEGKLGADVALEVLDLRSPSVLVD